ADDPLRVLRLVRLALDLGFQVDPGTAAAALAAAPELRRVSGERVFIALRRVQQSGFHHRDVHGHTLEVLDRTIALQADPAAVLGDTELAGPVAALLAEPLADELTPGDPLRWG